MGSFRFAALAALLLAFALLPHPEAARVLQGEKTRSSEGAPAPTAGTGGSEKSSILKESGQSSAAEQNPMTDKQHQKTPPAKTTETQTPPPPETTQTPPPPETTQTPKDSPPPPSDVPEDKKQEAGEPKVSAQPVPPTNVPKESPPPGGPESTGGKKKPDETEEVVEKCKDPVDICSIDGKLSACLQISKTASTGQFFIVKNTGQDTITVSVKATSDISIEQTLPPLNKGESKRVNISYINPNGGEITLNVGTESCVLHIESLPRAILQHIARAILQHIAKTEIIPSAYRDVEECLFELLAVVDWMQRSAFRRGETMALSMGLAHFPEDFTLDKVTSGFPSESGEVSIADVLKLNEQAAPFADRVLAIGDLLPFQASATASGDSPKEHMDLATERPFAAARAGTLTTYPVNRWVPAHLRSKEGKDGDKQGSSKPSE